jgi:hypothetical protein
LAVRNRDVYLTGGYPQNVSIEIEEEVESWTLDRESVVLNAVRQRPVANSDPRAVDVEELEYLVVHNLRMVVHEGLQPRPVDRARMHLQEVRRSRTFHQRVDRPGQVNEQKHRQGDQQRRRRDKQRGCSRRRLTPQHVVTD